MEQVKESIVSETVPLRKDEKIWIEQLSPLPVSVLNGMLTDQCIDAKGNKNPKILILVSNVEPKKLHELVTGCTGVENVGKAKAAPKAKAKAMANKKRPHEGKQDKEESDDEPVSTLSVRKISRAVLHQKRRRNHGKESPSHSLSHGQGRAGQSMMEEEEAEKAVNMSEKERQAEELLDKFSGF